MKRETLAIQRLVVYRELKRSFTTTNILESIMSLIGQKTDKVNYWKTSNQKQRWVATSLLYYRRTPKQGVWLPTSWKTQKSITENNRYGKMGKERRNSYSIMSHSSRY